MKLAKSWRTMFLVNENRNVVKVDARKCKVIKEDEQ